MLHKCRFPHPRQSMYETTTTRTRRRRVLVGSVTDACSTRRNLFVKTFQRLDLTLSSIKSHIVVGLRAIDDMEMEITSHTPWLNVEFVEDDNKLFRRHTGLWSMPFIRMYDRRAPPIDVSTTYWAPTAPCFSCRRLYVVQRKVLKSNKSNETNARRQQPDFGNCGFVIIACLLHCVVQTTLPSSSHHSSSTHHPPTIHPPKSGCLCMLALLY